VSIRKECAEIVMKMVYDSNTDWLERNLLAYLQDTEVPIDGSTLLPGKVKPMPLGPVEILEVKFPGNQFRGEIAPALAELVESGTIRIIDFLFVARDEEGKVFVTEFNDLGESMLAVFDPLVSEVSGLISTNDVAHMSEALEPNSSAAIMLFENVWATRFVDALRNANAELIFSERIPRALIEEAVAAAMVEEMDEELAQLEDEEMDEELAEAEGEEGSGSSVYGQ
jgi:hypothetical protein